MIKIILLMLLIVIRSFLIIGAVSAWVLPLFLIGYMVDTYGYWLLSLFIVYFLLYLPIVILVSGYIGDRFETLWDEL